MTDQVYLSYEFDQCYEPSPGVVEIRERHDPNGVSVYDEVVLRIKDKEHVIVRADRDQWGVYIDVGDLCVAQEDGTKSFLDALINCLSRLRENVEGTEPAKKVFDKPLV